MLKYKTEAVFRLDWLFSMQTMMPWGIIQVDHVRTQRSASSHSLLQYIYLFITLNQSCFLMVKATVREGHLLGSVFPSVTFHGWAGV